MQPTFTLTIAYWVAYYAFFYTTAKVLQKFRKTRSKRVCYVFGWFFSLFRFKILTRRSRGNPFFETKGVKMRPLACALKHEIRARLNCPCCMQPTQHTLSHIHASTTGCIPANNTNLADCALLRQCERASVNVQTNKCRAFCLFASLMFPKRTFLSALVRAQPQQTAQFLQSRTFTRVRNKTENKSLKHKLI